MSKMIQIGPTGRINIYVNQLNATAQTGVEILTGLLLNGP